MEKVVLPPQRKRLTDEEVRKRCPWAVTGRHGRSTRNVVTSLELDSDKMEVNNERFQRTYRLIEENEVRFEEIYTDDCDYLIVAFGSVARISQKAVEMARKEGLKIGILRPITLWPFPKDEVKRLGQKSKGVLVVEMNAGQMIEDVKLAIGDNIQVEHFGRLGGIVPSPDEILEAFKKKFINK